MEAPGNELEKGRLFVVTTPIGNFADMTLRGLRFLNEADVIVCEEFKEAVKLLKFFGIRKELTNLNEHNDEVSSREVFELIASGKKAALISDSGTPCFSDPGRTLLNMCFDFGLPVEFCGGANSVLTAIVLCGFDVSRFHFAGFISPKKDQRRKELSRLAGEDKPVILMDAPYRLKAMLEDIAEFFGDRRIFVGFDLTMETEMMLRGSSKEIIESFGGNFPKGEFVIIINHK